MDGFFESPDNYEDKDKEIDMDEIHYVLQIDSIFNYGDKAYQLINFL